MLYQKLCSSELPAWLSVDDSRLIDSPLLPRLFSLITCLPLYFCSFGFIIDYTSWPLSSITTVNAGIDSFSISWFLRIEKIMFSFSTTNTGMFLLFKFFQMYFFRSSTFYKYLNSSSAKYSFYSDSEICGNAAMIHSSKSYIYNKIL